MSNLVYELHNEDGTNKESLIKIILTCRGPNLMRHQGPIEISMLGIEGTKIIFQKVPVNFKGKANITSSLTTESNNIDKIAVNMDNFFMLIDPSIKEHNSVILNTNESNLKKTLCHGTEDNIICCTFNICLSNNYSITGYNKYTYHLVAFNGVRTYSQLYYGGVELCAVVACLNNSISSCGKRFGNYSEIVWPITFNFINTTASFVKSDQRVQFPTTLLSSIRPILPQYTSWKKYTSGMKVIRSHILHKPQNRLLTFGIFGRDFTRDWDPIRNTGSKKEICILLLVIKVYI